MESLTKESFNELLDKPFTVGYLRDCGILVEMNIRFFNPIGLRAEIVMPKDINNMEELCASEEVLIRIVRAAKDDRFEFDPNYLNSDNYKNKQSMFNQYYAAYTNHIGNMSDGGESDD